MRLHQITPFVPCTSLDAQIGFYCDILGFTLRCRADNYAFLKRDDVAVRLLEVDSTVNLHLPERQQSFYIDVDDVDGLYHSLRPKLSELPKGRVRALFDQHYGQREFHVSDEDCTLVFFGMAIDPKA